MSGCLRTRQGEGREQWEEGVTKNLKETPGGDGYVRYFDCVDVFTSVYIRQNLSDCVL